MERQQLDLQDDGPTPPPKDPQTSSPEKTLPNPYNQPLPPSSSPSASSDSSPFSKPSSESQMADYVLVFQAVSKKHLRSKTKVLASERDQVANEYEALIQRIRKTGLKVTSRQGAKQSGQILIFLKADDQLIRRFAQQEELVDFLHGVLTVEPQTNDTTSSESSIITPASRIRFVDSLLTLPLQSSHSKATKKNHHAVQAARVPSGAGLRIGHSHFPRLVDMSAIHDPEFNNAWFSRWSYTLPTNLLTGICHQDLDSIREHYGEDLSLYFGFLNFYFQALAPLALWGFGFWACGKPFSAVYSFGLVLWSCLFVELWRMRERKLAVRWGTLGVSNVDRRRHDFQPRITRIDPATDEEEEVFEWWRREIRVILSLPIMLFFAALLAATMTLMFVIEIFVTELYQGPFKAAIPFIPNILLVGAVPQIMTAWQATASALTRWENHHSSKAHVFSLTLKRFALQAVVEYGGIFLSAFVYIPFGETIMTRFAQQGFFKGSIETAIQQGKLKSSAVDFQINADRLHTQLFAVSVTSQAIDAFTEVLLPLFMRKFNEWREERRRKKKQNQNQKETEESGTESSSGTNTPTTANGETDDENEKREKKFISRVRKELELPRYDLFGDYAEMATQFGNITLWSVIWPLSPMMGFVNNFFELRSDAAKICLNQKRPVPVRAETIGPWLEVLGFIALVSAMSNSALVYLFQQSPSAHLPGHSRYEITMRSHLDSNSSLSSSSSSSFSFSKLLPSYIPTSGPTGAIITAILVSLSAEHLYGLIGAVIRHLLERIFWRDSNEEMIVRRREWRIRLQTLDSRVAVVDPTSSLPSDSIEKHNNDDDDVLNESSFWNQDKDIGFQIIRESGGKTD